jgi:FlaG/FlaF family flagellin (archaellin)
MMTKTSIQRDEHAVSPVIAVVMMIGVTVIIQTVLSAFAFDITSHELKTPNVAIVIEGADPGSTSFTIIHYGGDTIVNAFSDTTNGQLGTANWSAMEVRINGAVYSENDPANQNTRLNGAKKFGAGDFKAGDELKLDLSDSAQGTLRTGDSISVIYTMTGDTLRRVTVT